MDTNAELTATQRFRWGILLAWIPLLFFLIPTMFAFINAALSPQKATGLGAVAGGLSESLATFGLIATIGCEVGGIVLLVGTVSRSHPTRGVLAILSVCCSVLLLLALVLFLWLALAHRWR
jgi:hypothetical protein